ncbi:MAG: NADH-quinone oxidoreductase subunit NuoF [Deltaproteobacteria bacterium]|nr:NADH-quinone oxidoreductase subunit NuoF [Deltaproteobacteria bacterium]
MKAKPFTHLEKLGKSGQASLLPKRIKIAVGFASCGVAAGAQDVLNSFITGIKKRKLDVRLQKAGCNGMCHQEPLVEVWIPGKVRLTYGKVTSENVKTILTAIKQDAIPQGALFKTPLGAAEESGCADVPDSGSHSFYRKQQRVALRNCGLIDPENIEEYIALEGYQGLASALSEKTPMQVVNEVEKAGLRGRGGGGFSTGLKWKACRKARGKQKYIICNADEGDPGAYMDRSILEGDPHSVIEGMLIAGYAVGASQGVIYVRDEYPLAIQRLEIALEKARKNGIVGDAVLASDFSFDIRISRGAGAFVCGEETALIQSVEGACGEPRQRPPYPAVEGLYGCPTIINNVETLANVPVLIKNGAKQFSAVGTATSKGTKVFSLVGKVNNVGLVEVPMGISLREIIFDIGGGIPGDKAFKAVQTGGPSGGCIPESLIDLPVDYDELAQTGSIMGSGGLIVMDEKTCMVDVALYFLRFLEDESCGKCTPCRVGVRRMREILEDICAGRGTVKDLALLEKLAGTIKESALCGLGRTAPNPVLSTLKYFKKEYLAHIKDRKCPAGVCRELVKYSIDKKACIGCGACLKACPADAVSGEKKKVHKINSKKCIKCGACSEVCPVGAVLT